MIIGLLNVIQHLQLGYKQTFSSIPIVPNRHLVTVHHTDFATQKSTNTFVGHDHKPHSTATHQLHYRPVTVVTTGSTSTANLLESVAVANCRTQRVSTRSL